MKIWITNICIFYLHRTNVGRLQNQVQEARSLLDVLENLISLLSSENIRHQEQENDRGTWCTHSLIIYEQPVFPDNLICLSFCRFAKNTKKFFFQTCLIRKIKYKKGHFCSI